MSSSSNRGDDDDLHTLYITLPGHTTPIRFRTLHPMSPTQAAAPSSSSSTCDGAAPLSGDGSRGHNGRKKEPTNPSTEGARPLLELQAEGNSRRQSAERGADPRPCADNKRFVVSAHPPDSEDMGGFAIPFQSPGLIADVESETAPICSEWDERFKELCEYKRLHGHCRVPYREGKLGMWVNCLRIQHRYKTGRMTSSLTEEREAKLDRIGFVWKPKEEKESDAWEKHFNELCVYKSVHGHSLVRVKEGELGRWVRKQRSQYRRKKEGKRSYLTDAREAKLDRIGFAWIA